MTPPSHTKFPTASVSVAIIVGLVVAAIVALLFARRQRERERERERDTPADDIDDTDTRRLNAMATHRPGLYQCFDGCRNLGRGVECMKACESEYGYIF